MGIPISKPKRQLDDSVSEGRVVTVTVDESLPKKLRQEAGDFETELLPENFSHTDLLHLKQRCDKNKGHDGFIPIPKFTISDLPSDYQDEDVYQYILALANLTVKIETDWTSKDRPDGYHSASVRGTRARRVGTGLVEEVTKIGSIEKTSYECKICTDVGAKGECHYLLKVPTAKHLVFNTEEASHTYVLAFDNSDDEKVSNMIPIDGYEVIDSDLKSDWSMLVCLCHDEDLAKGLRRSRERLRTYGKRINKKHKGNPHPLAVLVSHPHGLSKQVSIGEWKQRGWILDTKDDVNLEGSSERSYYTYTAATCPGSSGAAVKIIGKGFGGHSHTHSKGLKEINLSGLGWNEQP